jgi:phosphoribosylaminoimidazole carboxylase PurK protein
MHVGIIGDGQLGRMLAIEAQNMGHEVLVLGPTPDSPAGQVAQQVLGDFRRAEDLVEFGVQVDVVTIEFEDANAEGLEALSGLGIPVYPRPATIRLIKNKYQQKRVLDTLGLPVTDYLPVSGLHDLVYAASLWGFPLMLKAQLGSYDGKGNVLVPNRSAILAALKQMEGRELYVERYVPFLREVAVVGARCLTGEISLYPVVETRQDHSVCHTVTAYPPATARIARQADELARAFLEGVDAVGVFGMEFFEQDDGQLLFNEVAPRVHNSGHWTLDGAETSQFRLHLQAILGEPLGSTKMTHPVAIMTNILGTGPGPAYLSGVEAAEDDPAVKVYWYGKQQQTLRRKLGHYNVVADDLETARRIAEEAHAMLIW